MGYFFRFAELIVNSNFQSLQFLTNMAKSAFFLLSMMALATACSSTKTESTETSTTVTDSTSMMSDSTKMTTDSTSTMTSDTTKKDSIK